ncbi:MAG: gamma-glutamyl-gamma-aminobutyrate hydrolase family protein [Bryobacteraceae bacterium]
MRVLAFRHASLEHLGRIEPELANRGIAIDYADLYQPGAAAPDPAGYDGLIFMGGAMSVNDGLPYLEQEARWIAEAVEAGRPVLGVCLGAQLIAKALGARVYPNPVKEIGWFEIDLTAEGAADPLFAGAGPRETVLQWHGETFDLPAGARWLASSSACRHQAFRIGRGAYALQFHLEVTPEMIADWCAQDSNCGDWRELRSPIDEAYNAARLKGLACQVFGRWCELLTIQSPQR